MASTTLESYMNKPDSIIIEIKQLSMNELKDAFFSLKINKSPGYDDISFNVVKKCFVNLLRLGILELRNRVPKPSYAKWRHTSSY